MHKRKEPDFMIELHRIREKLSRKWDKTTLQNMIDSLHESNKWLKSQLRSHTVK